MKKDLRSSWGRALVGLSAPIIIILSIRWAIFEPYIIPSGSMMPNLLIHDHVLVNKFAYGLRLPFGKRYVWQWGTIKRGDIIVFRYPESPEIFYVKRVVGLPGDEISWRGHKVFINHNLVEQTLLNMNQYRELDWIVQYVESGFFEDGDYKVKGDEVFVMGDHRDNSSDSRVWGGVKKDLILGRVSHIWMACNKMLDPSIRLCDPRTIEWARIGKKP